MKKYNYDISNYTVKGQRRMMIKIDEDRKDIEI